MTEHEPCPSFGWGFDDEYELCKYCTKALECMRETSKSKIAVQSGHNPQIPVAKKKEPLQIYFEKPKVIDGKVCIAFRIDAEWLKKQMGWGKYGSKE